MKRIKNFTLGILGATILSLSLYACSNDNETGLNNNSAEKSIYLQKGIGNIEGLMVNPSYLILENQVLDLVEVLNEKGVNNISDLSESESKQLFQPIANSTVDILVSHYGFNYDELKEEFGEELNDPGIVMFGTSMIVTTSHKFDSGKAIECAAEALGLNVFDAIRNIGGEVTKKVAIEAIKKVGVRVLGPIGFAITFAEWAWCYGR